MWLSIIAGLIFGIFAFAWWLGVFSSMEINEEVFSGGTFVYIDWKDEIKNISEPFKKLNAEFEKLKSPATANFMGIYYDDPGNLKDPKDFRACLGFLVNKNEGGAGQVIKYFEN